MRMLKQLFDSNKAWAKKILEQDPEFFSKLSRQQFPEYLWIGCSDSRVPANQIVDLLPGDLFVHRNVANVVVHTDLNCLSVMQFAVDILKVRHIMVVGHYGCSGVRAALRRDRIGISDNWLAHVQDVRHKHQLLIGEKHDDEACNRLCELNVIEQVMNVCRTTVIQDAWGRQQQLAIHGWIYGIQDGLLRDLNITVDGSSDLEAAYQGALSALHV